jgi:uncharacterized protein (DUF1800 family)
MPLNPMTEILGVQRAGHLLRRTVGGADIDTINAFALLSPQEAIERLIPSDINDLPDPPLPIDPLTNQEWITTGTSDANSEEFQLGRFLNAWMMAQQLGIEVSSDQKLPYTFRERLVFFLHTLFTTKQSVVNNSRAIYFQQALFRKYALDELDSERPNPDFDPEETENPLPETLPVEINIKALTKKISLDNAMLVFLDGRLNVNGNPNENYARELLELYSIGRGLEGNIPQPEFIGDYHYFTETDVQEGARVLSGFDRDNSFSTIDPETNLPRGIAKGSPNANRHDNGIKNFSSRLGGATILPDSELIATATGEELAIDEISQLVDLIYDQDETAIHICRKLYRFYVYHEVSQSLQDDIINHMAEVFKTNDFKIIPVIKALMTSTHFYQGESGSSDNNYGGLIKSPLDFVISFYNLFGIEIPNQNENLTEYYAESGSLLGTMQNQGMDLYEPFEVAGYSAYHQYPIYNRSWITTNYLTNRYQFIRDRISNGMNMEPGQVNVLAYVQGQVPDEFARDAKSLIIYLVEHIFTVNANLSFEEGNSSDLTSSRLNYFLNAFLFSPQIDAEPEESWTYRWDNQEDMDTVAGQLVSLFNALLQTPEFQLM